MVTAFPLNPREPVMGLLSWIRSRSLPLYRSHTPSGAGKPRSLMAEPGRDSQRMTAIKKAAAEDVAKMEAEDDKYFGHTPGNSDTD